MLVLTVALTAVVALALGLAPAKLARRRIRQCDLGWAAGLWLATWVFALCAYHRPGLTVGFDAFRLAAITALCGWASFCVAGLRSFGGRGLRFVVPLLLAAFVWLASPLLLGAILSAAVCHELGHWLVLRRVGGRIQRLHITVFGAEMQVDDRRISYGGELLTAAAGPVINLLLAAAMGLLGRWWEPLYLFAGAQLVLGAFNLLPALPLDGGRILWLALAWLTEPYTAQRVLSAVSLAVSLALLLGGGWFIWRLGGSPFLLVGAVGLTGWNLREIKLAKGG